MECVGVEDFIVTGIKNFLELHAFLLFTSFFLPVQNLPQQLAMFPTLFLSCSLFLQWKKLVLALCLLLNFVNVQVYYRVRYYEVQESWPIL